jgi:hypothetical protein
MKCATKVSKISVLRQASLVRGVNGSGNPYRDLHRIGRFEKTATEFKSSKALVAGDSE